ncbi:uncharacterized protein KY384_005393 [Bacidia gigantensis]|uniref:uncharacterized protein n=1 Tax=Bacidia gigantensis TaxID=2732470 RepID=UPI001D03BE6B|nr:uncharacterized protein KY384_005393 [Bacidia gigantensis]KAG8529912.1 hypothetical protein KY384_005393 [Bacidia gigantensis]
MSPIIREKDPSRQHRNAPIVPAIPRTYEKPVRQSSQNLEEPKVKHVKEARKTSREVIPQETDGELQIKITGDIGGDVETVEAREAPLSRPQRGLIPDDGDAQISKAPVAKSDQKSCEDHGPNAGRTFSRATRAKPVPLSNISPNLKPDAREESAVDNDCVNVPEGPLINPPQPHSRPQGSPISSHRHPSHDSPVLQNEQYSPSDIRDATNHPLTFAPIEPTRPVRSPSFDSQQVHIQTSDFPPPFAYSLPYTFDSPVSQTGYGGYPNGVPGVDSDFGDQVGPQIYSYYPPTNLLPSLQGQTPLSPSTAPLALSSPQVATSQGVQDYLQSAQTPLNGHQTPFTHGSFNTHRLGVSGSLHHQPSGDSRTLVPTSAIPSLPQYILRNFNHGQFADCRLVLTHSEARFPETTYFVHTLLVAQSPKLWTLLMGGQFNYGFDGLKTLRVYLTDRFIMPSSFEAALQVCYGKSATSFAGSTVTKVQTGRTHAELSASLLNDSLAFTAAGQLLQIREVVMRGLEISKRILNWDNVEQALSFALEGAEHRKESSSTSVVPNDCPNLAYESDSSAPNSILTPGTSQGSGEGSPGSGEYQKERWFERVVVPNVVHNVDDLLLLSLHYVAKNFPEAWKFDPTAKPLAHVDRLPVTEESISIQAKARLSKIQFGDLPSERTNHPSGHNSFISSILLSLPFAPLQVLLSWEDGQIKQAIRAIVEEREQRRLIVVKSESIRTASLETINRSEWSELFYKEQVDDIDGRSRLSRRHVVE